jgi:hypothetical protein
VVGLRQRVAELAASWIDPGVSGVAWLAIPPGKENWRNSLRIPAASREISGNRSE